MSKKVPKFGEKEVIQFIGIDNLEPLELADVQKISTKEFEKIKRVVKNITSLVVQVKTYKKEGNKKKYSIHLRCSSPTKVFESCRAHDWELARAVHNAFDNLKTQIKHTFKNDNSWKKPYA